MALGAGASADQERVALARGALDAAAGHVQEAALVQQHLKRFGELLSRAQRDTAPAGDTLVGNRSKIRAFLLRYYCDITANLTTDIAENYAFMVRNVFPLLPQLF